MYESQGKDFCLERLKVIKSKNLNTLKFRYQWPLEVRLELAFMRPYLTCREIAQTLDVKRIDIYIKSHYIDKLLKQITGETTMLTLPSSKPAQFANKYKLR